MILRLKEQLNGEKKVTLDGLNFRMKTFETVGFLRNLVSLLDCKLQAGVFS